jgi:two-component system sensor histidine kinase TctE
MIAGAAIIVWIASPWRCARSTGCATPSGNAAPTTCTRSSNRCRSEVEPLVDTVNGFMVRLQSALDALRNFTGNASHQLRTPLAIIRTQLALSARATSLPEAQAAPAKATRRSPMPSASWRNCC